MVILSVLDVLTFVFWYLLLGAIYASIIKTIDKVRKVVRTSKYINTLLSWIIHIVFWPFSLIWKVITLYFTKKLTGNATDNIEDTTTNGDSK